jgi:hypothetical protein
MRAKQTLDVATLRHDMAALIASNIFSTDNVNSPLFQAAYLWTVVNLHELLKATAIEGEPLTVPTSDEDVFDLVKRARYALVHAGGAYLRRGTERTGCIWAGPPSGYDDDIAVEIGGVRLLIRRHLVDAFEATCRRLDAAEQK